MTEQQIVRSDSSEAAPGPDEVWRDEIQARVARYRTRRGRRVEGTYSMRFPFVAPEDEGARPGRADSVAAVASESEAAREIVELCAIEPGAQTVSAGEVASAAAVGVAEEEISVAEAMPEASVSVEEAEVEFSELVLEGDPEPLPPTVQRPQAKRKVIAFPRQATMQEETYRLADPVLPEQPRILDVPEELEPFPTTPLLEGLQLTADQRAVTPARDHIELPYPAASIGRRVYAGLVDCSAVVAGSALFAAVAYKMMPRVELTKPLLLAAAILPVLLWAAYEYLLVMYAGSTAGMLAAKLQLSTFKGGAPSGRHRRSWVMGLYFSTASLGMGLLWSLVDVDRLCWHDRISHTYLAKRE